MTSIAGSVKSILRRDRRDSVTSVTSVKTVTVEEFLDTGSSSSKHPSEHTTKSTTSEGNRDPRFTISHIIEKIHGTEQEEKRETWDAELDFLLTSIGSAVGLGNMWRFPFYCHKNGGGAFILPYMVFFCFLGIPLSFLEVSVSQYMSRGGLQVWNIVPLFQGVGLVSMMVVYIMCATYSVVVSWVLFFMWRSFDINLPWGHCNNEYNTKDCRENFDQAHNSSVLDPVTEFWENGVLQINDGNSLGSLNIGLCLCLIISWVLLFLCLANGMRATGKISHITALAPYVILLTFTIHNLTFDGALDGVRYYVTPDFVKLQDPEVWADAAIQVFFSLGIGTGGLAAVGSYNSFNHNFYRDVLIVGTVDTITSLIAGITVFSVLGHMAKQKRTTVENVIEAGPGLVFIVYPKAVLDMPFSALVSFLYFLMLFLLALDSMFVMIAVILTGVSDQYPHIFRRPRMRSILTAVVCAIGSLISLPMVFEGGMYVYQMVQNYSGEHLFPLTVCIETIAIMGFFGADRYLANVRIMIGETWLQKTLPYMKFCLIFIDPIICIIMFAVNTAELTYHRANKPPYTFPHWAHRFGQTLSISCFLTIPLVVIKKLRTYGMSKKILKLMLKPHHLMPHQLLPNEEVTSCLGDYDEVKFHNIAV